MRKFIRSFIFIVAVSVGVGIGYGAVHTSGYVYGMASAYVAEMATTLSFNQPGQGGPEAEAADDKEDHARTKAKAYVVRDQDEKPNVSANSYLVADLKTGEILVSKSPNQRMPMASVTKLMTALVADETLGLDTVTAVSAKAIDTYGTQGGLRKGESYTVEQLFYPLLLESSNDAAEALAMTHDRDAFISAMNAKALALGLSNTAYEDASGLSEHNVSSASDLLKLAQHIFSYRKYLFDITTEKRHEEKGKTWFSNSKFRNDEEYIGGKNGFTDEAQKTQVALFEQKIGTENRQVVYIILHSNDIAKDVNTLRDWVRKNVDYR